MTHTPLSPMCARCFNEEIPLFDAPCAEKPETRVNSPLGMYHCPDCDSMVLAGVPHPPLCASCVEILTQPAKA